MNQFSNDITLDQSFEIKEIFPPFTMCRLYPSFYDIETALVKAGLQWFLDEPISFLNDGTNPEILLPFI